MRIVVSGGGSAGHITPTLAVCEQLKTLDSSLELLYIGQAAGMEARIVAAAGIPFAAIKAGKFRRDHFASGVSKVFNPSTLGPNARDSFRTVAGIAGSLKILRAFRPDVIFLKGGHVCLPVGIAAHMLKIPFVIHESDLHPGLTNRTLSRWATKIAVGFPVKNYHDFDPGRLIFTGNPVRSGLLGAHRLEGLAAFGLSGDLPVILVTGGSQGAREINDAILAALPQLLERYQIIHQVGEGEVERIKFELTRLPAKTHLERYRPFDFIAKDMPEALAAADLVIGRAGAGTIAESAALHKPTVLIPNTKMAGHQVENARMLSRAGAARVLEGAKLAPDLLVGEIARILDNPSEQELLGQGMAAFGRPDAAHDLARLVLDTSGGEGEHA